MLPKGGDVKMYIKIEEKADGRVIVECVGDARPAIDKAQKTALALVALLETFKIPEFEKPTDRTRRRN